MSDRPTTWYICCQNSATNERIGKAIGNPDAFHEDLVCADGKTRHMWECPSGVMFMLVRSRRDMDISFRVFGKQGNGKIYDKTAWLFRTERTRAKRPKRRPRASA